MQKPEKRYNDKLDVILGGLFCFIILAVVCAVIFATCSVSDEQKMDNKITHQFSAWNGSHRGLVRLAEENLRDPDSFQHIKTNYVRNEKDGVFDGTITVVMEYRAKNGFGGYAIGNIAAVYDIEGNLVKIEGTF